MTEQKNKCVYRTSIHTTIDKLWEALTTPDITKKYWYGFQLESDWKVGSAWQLTAPDSKVHALGEVVEINKPYRIALSWRDEIRPELMAEGYSRCVIDLEPHGDAVNLSITHSIENYTGDSKLIALVATSWPKVASNLKSFLETGRALPKL